MRPALPLLLAAALLLTGCHDYHHDHWHDDDADVAFAIPPATNPASPTAGVSFALEFSVENNGPDFADYYLARVYRNGSTLIATATITDHFVGQVLPISIPITEGSSGSVSYTVVLDAGIDLDDPDRSNNTGVAATTVALTAPLLSDG